MGTIQNMPINYFAPIQRMDHIVYTELLDEALLLDLQADQYYFLNTSGYKLWCWLQTPSTLYDLIDKFSQEYDDHPTRFQDDIVLWVSDALQKNILQLVPAPAKPGLLHKHYISPKIDPFDPLKVIHGTNHQFKTDNFETGS